MKNCIIAQSGGPTSVINSSLSGVLYENSVKHLYDNVYGGLKGINGILNNKIMNLSKLSSTDYRLLKYTPSAFLGSCRHKLSDFNEGETEYQKIFNLFDKYDINTFFYIGGNDSMDTVNKLSIYAKNHGLNTKIIGIPKTIDNDLVITDHTPGFGSACKYIATTSIETYLDSKVYEHNGVFIVETMGRDTGWLAASACIAKLNNKSVADYIYLPEVPFDLNSFTVNIRKTLSVKKNVFVVVSEGVKDKNGKFISERCKNNDCDKFGHAILGGVADYLKEVILNFGYAKKVRTLILSTPQRCSMHLSSKTDIDEAFLAGKSALDYSEMDVSGYMVGFKRTYNPKYSIETFLIKSSDVANYVKYFPKEWINESGDNVTQDAYNYIIPLIQGTPHIEYENGLPNYISLEKISNASY